MAEGLVSHSPATVTATPSTTANRNVHDLRILVPPTHGVWEFREAHLTEQSFCVMSDRRSMGVLSSSKALLSIQPELSSNAK